MDSEWPSPLDRGLRLRLEALGQDGRIELLRLLDLTGSERAAEIEALRADERLRSVLELLVDLDNHPVVRGTVVEELRIMKSEGR